VENKKVEGEKNWGGVNVIVMVTGREQRNGECAGERKKENVNVAVAKLAYKTGGF